LIDVKKLNVIINKNDIIIRNTERVPEDSIFKKLIESFGNNKKIQIKDKIVGPSENVIIAKCNNDEVILSYDIDYGISPIKCTAANIETIFNVVDKAIKG